jgi:hypothetical protein
MCIPESYSSTAYVKIIANGSYSSSDTAFVYSFDDGTQTVEKMNIDATTREITNTTTNNYNFTADYVEGLGGVRVYNNIPATATANKVYRTTSANTYLGAYVNGSDDKEEWILGNIPNVNALLFTPL